MLYNLQKNKSSANQNSGIQGSSSDAEKFIERSVVHGRGTLLMG